MGRSAIVVVLGLVLWSTLPSVVEAGLTVGSKAQGFSLPAVAGDTLRIGTLLGKTPVLVWFTNLCPGCTEAAPSFDQAIRGLERVKVMAVSTLGADTVAARRFLAETKASFPLLLDLNGKATEQWAGKAVPGTCPLQNLYFVNSKGIVQFTTHLPGIPVDELAKQLKALR